jgi:hypothetical protein
MLLLIPDLILTDRIDVNKCETPKGRNPLIKPLVGIGYRPLFGGDPIFKNHEFMPRSDSSDTTVIDGNKAIDILVWVSP